MNDVDLLMNFDVYDDIKERDAKHTIKIELENAVSSLTRECAIALAGAILRNNLKNAYGEVLNDKELADLMKDKLNAYVPDFCAKNVNVSLTKNITR